MKKFRPGFFTFFIIGNLFFLLANTPLFLALQKTPQNTFYPLIHQGHMDYYLYLSAIRESLEGSWTMKSLFSGEHAPESFFYIYFIVLGKLGSLFRLNQIVSYHLGRIISIEFMLVSIYLLCQEVLGRRWAFYGAFLSLFSTVLPLMYFGKSTAFPGWWSGLDALGRMDYLPHHAFGIAAFFTTVYFIFRKKIISATIFAFFATLVFPPIGLVFFFSLPFTVFITFRQKIFQGYRFILISFSSMVALFLMKWQTNLGFPWSQWKYWEMGLWNDLPNVNLYIILGGGVLLFFSLPAVFYIFLKKQNFTYVFLAVWAILPYLLLPFTDLIGVSRIRMAYLGNFLPLAILSTLTVKTLSKRYFYRYGHLTAILFLFLFSLFSFPVSYYFFLNRNSYIPLGYINIFIPKEMMNSIAFLGKTAKPYSLVLSLDYSGNIFPAFIKVKSYFAHVAQTKDYGKKMPLVQKFYKGEMTGSEAEEFIRKNGIEYIYLGPIEKSFGNIEKYNLLIKPVYNEGGIVIYKVI